ncbi:alanine--tRNA ligase, partial [Candidatus Desantisbacteria bacterium CG1_02_49_89]
MNSSEIRKEFLRFFEGENHKVLPSASLVADDPTLLFINAGMAPLKQYFFKRDEGITRATTVQKCLRTNDLEMVGKTNRHHTFFEMLGNFSFGDYFKKEACAWGWEFVTEKMNIPGDELWVTIYTGDTEASDAWKKLGIREERIVQFKENFWTMGETGPCGPCSEIIVDRGAGKGCGRKECDITCTCDRFIELWNLVFTQFDRQKDGSLVPLKQKNIDTGMGLERLTALVQGADSAFETDLFKPVIGYLAERYNLAPEIHTTALRVVSDHVRAAAFLISEGIYPSNEGRGYVLRRILRRAIRYGKKWDSGPFLYRLVPAVVEIMKDAYPELLEKREYASRVLLDEEKSFDATLNHGIRILQEIIEDLKKKGSPEIPGSDAFRLYDTYGMPLDFVKEIASENEMRVDEEGYAQEMGRQRSRSRESREKKEFTVTGTAGDSFSKFVGYDTMRSDTKIKALFRDEKEIDAVSSGEECIAVLVETPFYGESGGQIGDTGSLSGGSSKADVIDTQKPGLHRIKVLEGKISREDCVTAQVDAFRRSLIARHHTGTHLLQAALRQVLGMHVEQRGSLVTAEYLRFDFTHVPVIDKTELDKIE